MYFVIVANFGFSSDNIISRSSRHRYIPDSKYESSSFAEVGKSRSGTFVNGSENEVSEAENRLAGMRGRKGKGGRKFNDFVGETTKEEVLQGGAGEAEEDM